ncbi:MULTISPECIES: peptidoglycan-binding protein [unclassified Clostridium]|uniref:peptidoglycan-binding protein n=1 Tax=unclassified Clostridium TaxID=2614128 RepID=UPI000E3EF956|nr:MULTISPECIES: peptidoglycan-binding protein [unclassified Clostridium]RGD98314.1 peptidoglycan-binding protein [Clostridium sp. AM25-23AC]RGD99297.1 peptidoglycan-binding protein [Clostridium sp. AF28-12]RGE04296.1 peptidoglycan-binding protein [Clostridiaceae bacterium AF02-42]
MQSSEEIMAQGYLQVDVVSDANSFPVQDADIVIARTEEPDEIIEETRTNSSGQTENLPLNAPPVELSLSPEETERPYAEYTIRITAPGFEPFVVSGTEVLADVTAIQGIRLRPLSNASAGEQIETVTIPDHTLYGDYLPKIAESEIKPVVETGEIVLSRVVVPQTVVVHDGVPTNTSAANYYVPYRDYIKNVASSEIYATWPRSAIVANVLAIMSFTLNRVYTEWYRNQGYDFTITSSTAYDHKWIYGRNIFESISVVVDDIFDNYLSRPGVKQPILTQYCDGRKVRCPGWMTQWGSCELGEAGYSPIEILRNFYGDDMYINTAEQISGIPASWPGYDLKIGATGDKVRQLQEQLDAISSVYTAIPDISPDGIYGPATAEAVRKFQSIFGLPQTGVVDFATWYKISHIYVGITRIAELS